MCAQISPGVPLMVDPHQPYLHSAYPQAVNKHDNSEIVRRRKEPNTMEAMTVEEESSRADDRIFKDKRGANSHDS